MSSANWTTERATGHPIFRVLASFPLAFFSGALITDIAYAATANMMWADFSAWLLAAGLALGVLAAIAGIAGVAAGRRIRPARPVWLVLGSFTVLVLALLDNFVHSRDAWTSVVPDGLVLSAATVIVMLITVIGGAGLLVRRELGIEYAGVRS